MSPKSPGLGRRAGEGVFLKQPHSHQVSKLFRAPTSSNLCRRSNIHTMSQAGWLVFCCNDCWRFGRPIWNPFMVSFPYYSHIFRDPYGSGMGPIIVGLWTCHWHGVFSWYVLPVCCFDPWKYRLNTWHQSRSDIFFTQRYLRCTRNNAYIPENYHDKGKQPF